MQLCDQCGHDLPGDARFCDHCGARRTVTVQAVAGSALDRPEIRALLQRADELRADGLIGAALDLVQEAAEHVGPDPEWARLEYSVRATIARSAVTSGGVGEPLPGTSYPPMRPLARIETPVDAGPSVNPALLAFVHDGRLIRIPSGAFVGRRGGPLLGTLAELRSRGEARAVELPGLRARHVLCERQGGRVWVAGPLDDGSGDGLAVHDPDGGWSAVGPPYGERITALALGAGGRRVAVGSDRGEVRLIDIEAGKATVLGGRHLTREPIVRCGASADGDTAMAWAGRGKTVLLGPVVAAGQLRRLDVPHHDVTDVALAAGGRLVATIDEVGQLCFFRATDARRVGQVHLPVLEDPELQIGGADAAREWAVVRPGGNTLHCYELDYLVFVGEPVQVVRTKPEKLADGGRLVLGPFADFVVHADGERVAVFEARMRAVSETAD